MYPNDKPAAARLPVATVKDIDPKGLYSLQALLPLLPFSRTTVYVEIARKRFPRPVRVATRRVAFIGADVLHWFAEHVGVAA